jgi:hypothetical protein
VLRIACIDSGSPAAFRSLLGHPPSSYASAFVGLEGPLAFLVQVARWSVLIAGVMVALAVLYKVAPDRVSPRSSG